MSQQELLKKTAGILEKAEIPYMLTGSLVSSLQGEPRMTHDIDVIIAVEKENIEKITEAFPAPGFYIDESNTIKAAENKTMFNVIDLGSGDKIDFWFLTDSEFDNLRFSRKTKEKILGISIWISTPEDTILSKLLWALKSGGSEKQFTDALRVYEVQCEKLQLDYIDKWAQRLNLDKLWDRIKKEAEPEE